MLVISRHADQEIVFPHLGIRVSVLQVRGRLVKLGIEAPRAVKVFRQEILADEESAVATDHDNVETVDAERKEHRRRNELNLLQLRLESLQRRIDLGEIVDPESTLEWLLGNVRAFDQEIGLSRNLGFPGTAGRPLRLLIVEDSDNERRLLAYLLSQQGFDVHVARDGAEALQQIRMFGCQRPDVVLMDMQMPMSNGLETLQRIRDDEGLADLKVFAVTGFIRRPEHEPIGNGWDGWFQKPINISKLIECIRAETSGCAYAAGM